MLKRNTRGVVPRVCPVTAAQMTMIWRAGENKLGVMTTALIAASDEDSRCSQRGSHLTTRANMRVSTIPKMGINTMPTSRGIWGLPQNCMCSGSHTHEPNPAAKLARLAAPPTLRALVENLDIVNQTVSLPFAPKLQEKDLQGVTLKLSQGHDMRVLFSRSPAFSLFSSNRHLNC